MTWEEAHAKYCRKCLRISTLTILLLLTGLLGKSALQVGLLRSFVYEVLKDTEERRSAEDLISVKLKCQQCSRSFNEFVCRESVALDSIGGASLDIWFDMPSIAEDSSFSGTDAIRLTEFLERRGQAQYGGPIADVRHSHAITPRLTVSFMSVDYAAGLSPYANKGICGLPEYLDEEDALNEKIEKLYQLLSQSHYTVVHTGAGISTSAGIPDFRGPKGVWTLEEQGKNPSPSVAFEKAVPSFTHRALVKLERQGVIHYLITQNIDGLHLRSGFPRDRMSILHGDAFIEQCNRCGTNYIRSTPSKTMGLRPTGVSCTLIKSSSRACRGKICDTILDWESDLPSEDYNRAIEHSKRAELHLCIGTSLQMLPAASLPLLSLQTKASCRRNSRAQRNSQCPLNHSKLVIINLQRTKLYRRAWINIHASADTVFKSLMDKFGFQLPESTPQSPDAVFTPLVILRSCNSDPKEENPWHILPHPTEGAGIRIVDCSLPVSANPVILQCKKEDDDPISTGVIRKQSSSLAMEEKYTNSDEEDVKRLKTEDMKVVASFV
ncbi:unnamed protein product [Calicophoron daubneyi]|uniref:protein acetyllysine N-acetyltransferase n=1 Tax=Calicophoron daubneyi TaxID=300641 RepID=A0AAV2TLT2_CALDB